MFCLRRLEHLVQSQCGKNEQHPLTPVNGIPRHARKAPRIPICPGPSSHFGLTTTADPLDTSSESHPQSKVVGALSERIPLPHTVDIAEALACRRAMCFAKELGIKSEIVEGDSEKVIKSMSMDPECLAPHVCGFMTSPMM
nr:hypothetical protein CFP56_53069 [Quercus suber]